MVTKNALVQARMEESLKREAESILHSLGLSASEAINVFYRMVVAHRGLPFEMKIPDDEFLNHARASIEKNRRLAELLAK